MAAANSVDSMTSIGFAGTPVRQAQPVFNLPVQERIRVGGALELHHGTCVRKHVLSDHVIDPCRGSDHGGGDDE